MTPRTILTFSSDVAFANDESLATINDLVRKHFPEDTEEVIFFTQIKKKESTILRMDIDPFEQPFDFRENLASLIQEVGPLCKAPFFIMVRSDTLDDERDEFIYGGPDAASIEKFQLDHLAFQFKEFADRRVGRNNSTPKQLMDAAAKILANHSESTFSQEEAKAVLSASLTIATASGLFDEMQNLASNPDAINNFCDAFETFANPKHPETHRP